MPPEETKRLQQLEYVRQRMAERVALPPAEAAADPSFEGPARDTI